MTVIVPQTSAVLASEDLKIGKPASSIRFALSVAQQLNHLLGYLSGTLLSINDFTDNYGEVVDGRGDFNFKFYKHPNVRYVIAYVRYGVADKDAGFVSLKVGTNATITHYVPDDYRVEGGAVIRASASGSDYLDILIHADSVPLLSVMLYGSPVETLGGSYQHIEEFDSGRVGLHEGLYITESDTAGIHAIIDGIRYAKTHMRAVAVCEVTADQIAVAPSVADTDGEMNPYGITFQHKASPIYGDDVEYRCFYRTWCDAGLVFTVRITSDGDSISDSNESNNTPEWNQRDFTISSVADDTITLTLEITAGTGNAYISSFFVIRYEGGSA